MIEENGFRYLDKEDIARIHAALSAWTEKEGEPVPPFSLAKEADIDSLVNISRHRFFDREAYPTLEEKAAIIFYTVNKRQIFLNGNKRMSTLCLLVFLGVNDKTLAVGADELTDKALWLAKTDTLDFPSVKKDLAHWIHSHLVDYGPNETIADTSTTTQPPRDQPSTDAQVGE